MALVGITGSGKSTLLDILMGLLKPTSGEILIDGVNMHDPKNISTLLRWRSSLAHVPQDVFLADCSVASNVAFGVSPELIDMDKVREVCAVAQAAEFIDSLPSRYQTIVGEDGVLLSGGQRQRIGIARALYKGSSILFLDEATSALDELTEERVMQGIQNLSCKTTLVMISHRPSTIRNCDLTLNFSNGKISKEYDI